MIIDDIGDEIEEFITSGAVGMNDIANSFAQNLNDAAAAEDALFDDIVDHVETIK